MKRFVLLVALLAGCATSPSTPAPEPAQPRRSSSEIEKFLSKEKPRERPIQREIVCFVPEEITLREWCEWFSRRHGVNVIAEGSAGDEKISVETLERLDLMHGD